MSDRIFVGREKEIRLLKSCLQKANDTQSCLVSFIAGDIGAGKTTLAEQFATIAEGDNSKKTFVAIGKCNAQTGSKDTYLPFREILNQFTGVQSNLLRSSISNNPPGWFKLFLDSSLEAFLEFAPDLIGTFIPGASLLARLGRTTINDTLKKRAESRAGNQEVKRETARQQYLAILQRFPKDVAVILIIDDLQWADDASLDLFIYLVENSKKSSNNARGYLSARIW